MSNAMSRSKSRWKGSLLTAAAIAAISPLAAKAQNAGTMSLSLTLSPLGDGLNYGSGGLSAGSGGSPLNSEYIAPDQNVNIYVYATITQASPIVTTGSSSTSGFAGLQYAYFNVMQNTAGSGATTFDTTGANLNGVPITGINASEGTILSATPNATLHFNSFGSQSGVTNYSSGIYAVGNGTPANMTAMAKPRAAAPAWSTNSNATASNGYSNANGLGDGTNVYVDGNQISFLVETLVYKPQFGNPNNPSAPGAQAPVGTVGGNGVNVLTVSVPTIVAGYAGSNYFTGLNSIPSTASVNNGSVGASYTHTLYSASGFTDKATGTVVAPTVTLYDAALGDSLLQGDISYQDYGVVANNYGANATGFTNGDFNGGFDPSLGDDGSITYADYGDAANNYGVSYGGNVLGTAPAGVLGSPTAILAGAAAVPEPASLALVSLASLGLLRRCRSQV